MAFGGNSMGSPSRNQAGEGDLVWFRRGATEEPCKDSIQDPGESEEVIKEMKFFHCSFFLFLSLFAALVANLEKAVRKKRRDRCCYYHWRNWELQCTYAKYVHT